MGRNLMAGKRRHEVIELARRTLAEQLNDPAIAHLLAGLPQGEPHKVGRPPGDPATWPPIGPAARAA
jgi:hypothetical protein